jgi:M6 family metalloprotease-like protein
MKSQSIAQRWGKKNLLLILIAGCLITTLFSRCTPVGQGPTDNYCTSGQSCLTIDDSKVSTTLKNRVYSPGSTLIHNKHVNYNPSGKTVVIPYETTDFRHNPMLTTSIIKSSFFASGTGSVTDYFNENSWGQFHLTDGGVSDLVSLNKAYTDYPFTESDWRLMTDLCQNSTIDWKSLDVNNDHIITQNEVQIVFTMSDGGLGATRPPRNGHSPYQYDYITITTPNWTGQIINRFVYVGSALKGNSVINPFEYNYSTIWHELCHAFFRLPDRYANGTCETGSTGRYDLMSDNCSKKHMNIYDKMRIGWIQPKICYTNVSSSTDLVPIGENLPGGCISLTAIENQPTALIRWTSTAPDEMWIFENKNIASSPRKFEAGLPESGLAVWYVDLLTENVILIDNSKGSLVPTSYKDQGEGALFKYSGTPSASIYSFTFYNKSNNLAFFLRSVSPPAGTMYFSF